MSGYKFWFLSLLQVSVPLLFIVFGFFGLIAREEKVIGKLCVMMGSSVCVCVCVCS